MYCNNCGAETENGNGFCEQCGHIIEKETMTPQSKSKKNPIIIAVIAAVLLLAAGVGILSQTGILNPIEHNLKLGYKYLEDGKYEEAVLAFDKVIAIDENNIKAQFGLADAYEALGEYESAAKHLRKILKFDVDNDKAKDKLNALLKKFYADKDLQYTIEEKDVNVSEATFKGIIRCKADDELVWEHETETAARTELDMISDVYEDEDVIYYVCADKLNSLDKYTGERLWKAKDVGGSNSIVYDKENIYISGYYGPDLVVISKKDGKELYRYNNDDVYWVYDLKADGKEIALYYSLPKGGSAIERIDVSDYISNDENDGFDEAEKTYSKPNFDEVQTSSVLKSEGELTYFASNAVDGDLNTAWVEGVSGSGIGEKIFFKSAREQKVSRLQIMNGYCKSAAVYAKNNRVKSIRIVFSDGTRIERDLKDEFAQYDIIVLPEPVICDEFYIEITDIYRGTHYDDTCITEIAVE